MFWYIIGNLIGLLLLGLAIKIKEGNHNASPPAQAPAHVSSPAESSPSKDLNISKESKETQNSEESENSKEEENAEKTGATK